jgi:hypothetical protein
MFPFLCSGGASSWSFVAAGTTSNQTNPVPTLPSGWAQNDLLVIVAASGSGGGFSTLSGWTEVVRYTTVDPYCSIWYKIAGSSESAPTLTNTSSKSTATILAYRNINATPLDVIATFQDVGPDTTFSLNTMTTTVDNDLVLNAWVSYNSGTSSAIATPPSGCTQQINIPQVAGVTAGVYLFDENKYIAGLTTARTIVLDTSTFCQNIAVAFKKA